MKNEHIIYAYAERGDAVGGHVLIVGLTEQGMKYLKDEPGRTLVINQRFPTVTQVVVYHGKDKAELKATLRQAGIPVSEVN